MMARARSTSRKRKAPNHYGNTTFNSTNTGIPAKEWFQPRIATDDEERTELIERVTSYVRHLDLGMMPIDSLPELLDEVVDRLQADAHFAPEHEAAVEKLARCEVKDDLVPVIRAALTEYKRKHTDIEIDDAADDIAGAVVALINDGIELTESST